MYNKTVSCHNDYNLFFVLQKNSSLMIYVREILLPYLSRITSMYYPSSSSNFMHTR